MTQIYDQKRGGMMKETKWFFAEGLDTREWEMHCVIEEAGETETDFVVGQTLSQRAREERRIEGEWVVRLVPNKDQQELFNLLRNIDRYADSHSCFAVEGLVQAANKADRQTKTNRRKQTVALA